MIRFAVFNNRGLRVAFNPQNVTTVLANGETCKVFTTETGDPMTVLASFDEAVATLEAAAAPPAPAPVVVEPSDLERAAKLMEILADGADDSDYRAVDEVAIDQAIGADGVHRSDSIAKLRALANRLRGVAR